VVGEGRWERLWGDLAAQAEQWERDEAAAEAADRVRLEHAALGLLDRVRAHQRQVLAFRLRHGITVRAEVLRCGPDWVALAAADGSEGVLVLPVAGIVVVEGLGTRAVPVRALGAAARAADLTMVLRRIAAAGVHVALTTADGAVVRGRVARVGRDHVDVATDDAPRRTLLLAAVDQVAAG
jgi:hypothetical protein